MDFTVQRAVASDVPAVTVMVGRLLAEIMNAIGERAFNFDLAETSDRLTRYVEQEKYFVFMARDGAGCPAGFIAMYESCALYAEGTFGTIPELYVEPQYRSSKLGRRLVASARDFAAARG